MFMAPGSASDSTPLGVGGRNAWCGNRFYGDERKGEIVCRCFLVLCVTSSVPLSGENRKPHDTCGDGVGACACGDGVGMCVCWYVGVWA